MDSNLHTETSQDIVDNISRRPVGLTGLPNELLSEIVRHLPLPALIHLRNTAARLRCAVDASTTTIPHTRQRLLRIFRTLPRRRAPPACWCWSLLQSALRRRLASFPPDLQTYLREWPPAAHGCLGIAMHETAAAGAVSPHSCSLRAFNSAFFERVWEGSRCVRGGGVGEYRLVLDEGGARGAWARVGEVVRVADGVVYSWLEFLELLVETAGRS